MHRLGVLLAALLLALVSAPPVAAIEPPTIDPAAVPPDETGPDQPTEQRRVCSAPTVFPEREFRGQALGKRLPADQRGAEVRNGRGDNCRRNRHRGHRLAAGARGTRRGFRRPGRRRHVRLRFPRNAHRVDHRGAPRARPTDSSVWRPKLASCRCGRPQKPSSRSAHAATPTTRTPHRPPARCAAWRARSCTRPTSARRSSTSASRPATR